MALFGVRVEDQGWMTSPPPHAQLRSFPAPAEEAKSRSVEERFRALVASVKDYAIFMLDPSGRIETWNKGAEHTKGYSAEEIIGQHMSRFYTPEDLARGLPATLLARAVHDGRVESEGWRVRKDGSRFWADVVITALVDDSGRLLGFAKVTRDLTERLRAQQEQVRLAHAEEAVRLRDEFLSIAAHELRTPLSAVQLQLQSLLERPEGLDPRARLKLERACRSGDRLVRLVDTLLDVSRIATGSLTLTPSTFDLTDAVREVVDRFGEHAVQARSTVSISRLVSSRAALTLVSLSHLASGISWSMPALSDPAQERQDQKSDCTYPSKPHSVRRMSVRVYRYSVA